MQQPMKGIMASRKRVLPITLALLLTFMVPLAYTAQQNTSAPSKQAANHKTLPDKLRSGGYVVYIRPGPLQAEQTDKLNVKLADCQTQRNLNAQGKALAEKLQIQLQRLNIPVGKVLASPYCRTRQTAQIIFPQKQVSTNKMLGYLVGLKPEVRQRRSEFLQSQLKRLPGKGQNTIIIGHPANLKEAAGIWPPPGAAVIFRAKGIAGFKYIALINPDEWKSYD